MEKEALRCVTLTPQRSWHVFLYFFMSSRGTSSKRSLPPQMRPRGIRHAPPERAGSRRRVAFIRRASLLPRKTKLPPQTARPKTQSRGESPETRGEPSLPARRRPGQTNRRGSRRARSFEHSEGSVGWRICEELLEPIPEAAARQRCLLSVGRSERLHRARCYSSIRDAWSSRGWAWCVLTHQSRLTHAAQAAARGQDVAGHLCELSCILHTSEWMHEARGLPQPEAILRFANLRR